MAGGGTRWDLRSLLTQPILWFCQLTENKTTERCRRVNFSSDWQTSTCFYNPSDTRMREGSSVKTFPVPAKMSVHPPNAAWWDRACAASLRNTSVESFSQILLLEKDIPCRNMRNLGPSHGAAGGCCSPGQRWLSQPETAQGQRARKAFPRDGVEAESNISAL